MKGFLLFILRVNINVYGHVSFKVRTVADVISHYYTYLENHMDADSVSHMIHSKHLITDDDYDVISRAPNDVKMNCLILQYVKLMNISDVMKFCAVLKEIESLKIIGNTLENCEKTFM